MILKDFQREIIGSDFLFVLLEMDEEDALGRIKMRHDGAEEKIINRLKVIFNERKLVLGLALVMLLCC